MGTERAKRKSVCVCVLVHTTISKWILRRERNSYKSVVELKWNSDLAEIHVISNRIMAAV